MGRFALKGIRQHSDDEETEDLLSVDIVDRGQPITLEGRGNGPIAAFVNGVASLGCGSGFWTT